MPKRLSNDDPGESYSCGFSGRRRKRDDDEDGKPKPIYTTCNVCGRGLVADDEFEMGMCLICAAE